MSKNFITMENRIKEFPEDFEILKGKFMCKYCNKVINWKKEDTIKKHLRADSHKKNKYGGMQLTLEKTKGHPATRSEVLDDFLEMIIECDIPLYKVDKMKPFLKKHCIDGGSIPSSLSIRTNYLNNYCEHVYLSVLSKIKNEHLSLLVDGSSDKCSRKVLHVIAKINSSGEQYMIDCSFLKIGTAIEIANRIFTSFEKFGIDIKNVDAFVNDSASTMKKVCKLLQERNPKIIYSRCIAHLLNLAMEVFASSQIFKNVKTIIEKLQYLFNISGSRKHRYIEFLSGNSQEEAKLMPKYTATRWATWYDSCYYLCPRIDSIVKFVKEERIEQNDSETINALGEILVNESLFFEIKAGLIFINEFTPFLVNAIRDFEKEETTAYEIFSRIMGIFKKLSSVKDLSIICPNTNALLSSGFLKSPSITEVYRKAIKDSFIFTIENAKSKLSNLLDKYESFKFLQDLSVLDPDAKESWELNYRTILSRLPYYLENETILEREITSYYKYTPKNNKSNILEYWKSLHNESPNLSPFAVRLLNIPCTTVEVEKSFGTFKQIFRDARTAWTMEHLSQWIISNYNINKLVKFGHKNIAQEKNKKLSEEVKSKSHEVDAESDSDSESENSEESKQEEAIAEFEGGDESYSVSENMEDIK